MRELYTAGLHLSTIGVVRPRIHLSDNQPMVNDDSDSPGEFAKWLREKLKPRGKTRELVAWMVEKTGFAFTPQNVDKWKNGSEPERVRLKAVAEFFGVDYVFLLRMFDPDVPLPQKTQSIHGNMVTPEGALIGAEWDRLEGEEKRVVSVMIHALVREKVLAERKAAKSSTSAKAPRSAEARATRT